MTRTYSNFTLQIFWYSMSVNLKKKKKAVYVQLYRAFYIILYPYGQVRASGGDVHHIELGSVKVNKKRHLKVSSGYYRLCLTCCVRRGFNY